MDIGHVIHNTTRLINANTVPALCPPRSSQGFIACNSLWRSILREHEKKGKPKCRSDGIRGVLPKMDTFFARYGISDV